MRRVRGFIRRAVAEIATALEPLRWRKHRLAAIQAAETERLTLRLERQRQKEERVALERRDDADRQMRLIESLFDNLRDIDERRSNDLRALAQGVGEQAKGFQEWIKLFAQTPGEPKSTTVRDEDEWRAEQERFAEMLAARGYPIAGDPMAQLEFVLRDE